MYPGLCHHKRNRITLVLQQDNEQNERFKSITDPHWARLRSHSGEIAEYFTDPRANTQATPRSSVSFLS